MQSKSHLIDQMAEGTQNPCPRGKAERTEMFDSERKGRTERGGQHCLPQWLTNFYLRGSEESLQPPLRAVRDKVGQVREVRFQQRRLKPGREAPRHRRALPRGWAAILGCLAWTKSDSLENEIPRGTHLGCPQ